jgi:hypothetical protein
VLRVLDIRTISVDILRICDCTIAMRALVRVGVGRAGRLVALEKARCRISRVLLTLHQFAEPGNARGHAKGAKSEVSLRRSFNVLRSSKSSTAAARLIEWIGLAPVSARFDSVPPRGLRPLFTIFLSESLKVAEWFVLCRSCHILPAILGE